LGATPEQQAQKRADCDAKKKRLDSYKTATKIVETDSLGRQHEYTEEEKKQLIQKTQQAVQETCGVATAGGAPGA
jgi:hypothetical protein